MALLRPNRRGLGKPAGLPALNPRHPLSQGLLNFTLLDGYTAIDLAAQQPATITGVLPGLIPFGTAGAYTGSTPKVQFPYTATLGSYTLFSVVVGVFPTSFTNFSLIASRWDEPAFARSWALAFFADGRIYFYASPDGTTFAQINAPSGLATNTFAVVGATLDASGNGVAYVHGIPVVSGAVGVILNPSRPWHVGFSPGFGDTTDQSFAGSIAFAGLWGRTLGGGEMAALASSPYQHLFWPCDIQMSIPIFTAAGGDILMAQAIF